jgi:uncharacterized protein
LTASQIFVDTSFIVALINERDQYHEKAIELVDRYDGQSLIITDVVLLEIANALARGYKMEAVRIIEELISSEDVEIVHLTTELFNQAFDLYKTHQDKAWGLVDCISFVVMQKRNVRLALSFDRHFVQAGFQALPLVE